MMVARGVARRLQAHAEINNIDQHLHMALGLHAAAHQAEAHDRLAVFHHEGGDDGVEGPLARRVNIGVALVEREQGAAILENKAQPVGHQPRAHAAIIGLDQGDHHAVLVGHGQVDGITLRQLDIAVVDAGHGMVHMDQRPALGGIFL